MPIPNFPLPRTIIQLIAAHWLLSLGGLLLHVRIHPFSESLFNWWAIGFAGANVFIAPVLFASPRWVGAGWLLNWATVIVGTVGMAYFSLLNEAEATLYVVFLKSTFPDIVILWAKLPLGYLLLDEWRKHAPVGAVRGCRG
jgi:hypothetical protein